MEAGWAKVIAATVVAVLGLGGFNLAVWRRLSAARAARERGETTGGTAVVASDATASAEGGSADRYRGDR